MESPRFHRLSIIADVELEIEVNGGLVPIVVNGATGATKDGRGLAVLLERIELRRVLVGDQGGTGCKGAWEEGEMLAGGPPPERGAA